jgi:hypothetical protein
MAILTDGIASWTEDFGTNQHYLTVDDIATESRQSESPVWEVCIDSLLKLWADPSQGGDCTEPPSRESIAAAIEWITILRKRFPQAPPTFIAPEPAGGVIVERRVQSNNSHDCICELTFYNSGRAERTDYRDGKVLEICEISYLPLRVQGSRRSR